MTVLVIRQNKKLHVIGIVQRLRLQLSGSRRCCDPHMARARVMGPQRRLEIPGLGALQHIQMQGDADQHALPEIGHRGDEDRAAAVARESDWGAALLRRFLELS